MNIEVQSHTSSRGLTGVWVRIGDNQYIIGFLDGVEIVVDRVTNPKRRLMRYGFDTGESKP